MFSAKPLSPSPDCLDDNMASLDENPNVSFPRIPMGGMKFIENLGEKSTLQRISDSQNNSLLFFKPIPNSELLFLSKSPENKRTEKSLKSSEIPFCKKSLLDSRKSAKRRIDAFISSYFIVKKFIKNLRNSTIYRRMDWLTDFHFNIINDLSSNLETGAKYFKFLGFLNKKTLNEKWILDPLKGFHVFFDILLLFVIISCFIAIPIDLGFNIDLFQQIFANCSLKTISLLLFIIDIGLNFNTAFYQKGQLINKRLLIIKHYLKGSFLKDLLSLSYFLFDYGSLLKHISGVLFLLRMGKVTRILTRFEEFLFIDEKFYNYLLFFKLVFRIVVFSHFFACIWHYIGSNTEGGWVSRLFLLDDYWEKRYLLSLYYVVVVMNTVGFGDITPVNSYEIAFTIVFIYCACGLFAYTINSIGIILQNINKNERELKRSMNTLNGYMRHKKINLPLRTKIRNFLEYIWYEEQYENEEAASEVINKLSRSLKDELLLNANGVILKNFSLFHKNFSEESLRKLVGVMKEVKFIPGDLIYRQTETQDPCIYLIKKGKVEIFVKTSDRHETLLETLRKGEHFGSLSFFSNQPRETSARTSSFTSVYAIKRQSFIDILTEEEEDYQCFCRIKDQIVLYNDFKGLFLRCLSCKEDTHPTIYCPFLQIAQNTQRILHKHRYSQNQKREEYCRRGTRKKAALKGEIREKSLETINLNESSVGSNYKCSDQVSDVNIEPIKEENFKSTLNLKNPFSVKNKRRLLHRFHSLPLPTKSKRLSTSIKDVTFLERNLRFPLEEARTNNIRKKSCVTTEKSSKTVDNNDVLALEKAKSFVSYFPHNNFERVIHIANALILTNLKKQGKLKARKSIRRNWAQIGSEAKQSSMASPKSSKMRLFGIERGFFKNSESPNKVLTKIRILELLKKHKIAGVRKKKKGWVEIIDKLRKLVRKSD